MDKKTFILTAMSPAGKEPYTDHQIQALLFLLDKKAGPLLGGPYFEFPQFKAKIFDQEVAQLIRSMQHEFLDPTYDQATTQTMYTLTHKALDVAEEAFRALPSEAREYIEKFSEHIRRFRSQEALNEAMEERFPDYFRTEPGFDLLPSEIQAAIKAEIEEIKELQTDIGENFREICRRFAQIGRAAGKVSLFQVERVLGIPDGTAAAYAWVESELSGDRLKDSSYITMGKFLEKLLRS